MIRDRAETRLHLLIVLVILAVVLAFVWYRRLNAPTSPGPSATEASDSPAGLIYLQTDPRWRNDEIGGSGERLESVGCVVCCICMALEQRGVHLNPRQLNELLKVSDGYTKQGWVKWNTVSKVTGNKIAFQIPETPNPALIDSALKDGRQVIAKVLIGKSVPHWVLIVGKEGSEYLVKDPLGNGRTLEKLSKYKSGIQAIRIVKAP